ncbi:hypothetical protein J6590_010012 [Homalodisca vitripennis]|nr:hypothetical protein J6590_010012 [Homalodisca vitripennis]
MLVLQDPLSAYEDLITALLLVDQVGGAMTQWADTSAARQVRVGLRLPRLRPGGRWCAVLVNGLTTT